MLIFRISCQSMAELEEIRAEALALVKSLEDLSDADWQRLRPLFDRFFLVLARVQNNLILVDVDCCQDARQMRRQ